MALFDATNLDPDLAVAYELKEAFRVAMAIGRASDTTTFAAGMDLFDAQCRASGIEAFAAVAKTFRD